MARVCLDRSTTRAQLEQAMASLGWALARHLERGAFHHGGMVWTGPADTVATYTEYAALYARVVELPDAYLEDLFDLLDVHERVDLLELLGESAADEVERMEAVLRLAALVLEDAPDHEVEDALAEALMHESIMVRRAAFAALDVRGWTTLEPT
ncbi:MAG: hypothetical protein AAGI01_16670, partial [Myxococcota bacterium]